MTVLVGPRLNLVPTTRAMMARRLQADRFAMRCDLADGPAEVAFPPSWPGDALDLFPAAVARLASSDDAAEGSWIAVLLQDHVVAGGIGTKGPPNAESAVEIGYGFGEEFRGRGLATEAVVALTRHLLVVEHVAAVTAETAVWNTASARVLEKAGFLRTGTGWSEEDGDLLLWTSSGRAVR